MGPDKFCTSDVELIFVVLTQTTRQRLGSIIDLNTLSLFFFGLHHHCYLRASIHIISAWRETKNTKEQFTQEEHTEKKEPLENMTAPFDFRQDVEIPDDLIARLCAGEKQEKVIQK